MRIEVVFLALSLLAACAHKSESAEKTDTPAPAVAKTATDVSKPTAPAAADANKTVCTHDKETRTLEVTAKNAGCELTYHKNDTDSVVATSHKGKKHCQQASTKIQEKLTAAGYTCK